MFETLFVKKIYTRQQLQYPNFVRTIFALNIRMTIFRQLQARALSSLYKLEQVA